MGTLTMPVTGTVSGVAENEQINSIAAALATMSQGSTAPTESSTGLTSIAGLFWHNTSNGQVCVRNQADSAWILIGTINESTGTFTFAGSLTGYLPTSGGTLTGELTVQAGGLTVVAGGLNVEAGGAAVTGPVAVTGTVSATGAISSSAGGSFGAGVTAAGQVVSTSGGFKFPDGSVQTAAVSTAGLASTASLGAYAPLASPALTGSPTAPTPATSDNSTAVATTAFVQSLIAAAFATYAGTGTYTGPEGGGGGG